MGDIVNVYYVILPYIQAVTKALPKLVAEYSQLKEGCSKKKKGRWVFYSVERKSPVYFVSAYVGRQFYFIRIVFLLKVKYSYDLARYKGEIFLKYSYFSE